MQKTLMTLKNTLEDQVKFGPSESAQLRMLGMVEAMLIETQTEEVKMDYIEKTLYAMNAIENGEPVWPHGDAPRDRAGNFLPDTAEFNAYVWNKVNCERDIENIAARYDITKEDVRKAYQNGRDAQMGV